MIKNLVLLLFTFFSLSVEAQFLIEKPLYRSHQNLSHQERSIQATDTAITLPLYEDFSLNNQANPDVWEYNSSVFISPSAGVNPPTINVAVFDGINGSGIPYDETESASIAADSLITYPILMTQVPENKRNSVYLSFFWQAKGLGEMPDEADSLTLQFLDIDSTWVYQKIEIHGGEDAIRVDPDDTTQLIFVQSIVPITDSIYYHDDFRIKFQNFGSVQGPFDSWMLDYIYVNYDRGPDSLFYFDRAMAQLPTSPLGEYYSIPFDHFMDSTELFSNPIAMESSSLSKPSLDDPLRYFVDLIDSAGNLLSNINIGSSFNIIPGNKRYDFESNKIELNNFFDFSDTLEFEIKAYLDSDDGEFIPNSTQYSYYTNDTISRKFALERHYAYDDGTAEFAAGISISEGRLVIAYPIQSLDTLTHIDINFPQIVPGEQGDELDILVLKDLSGTPESELVVEKEYRLTQATDLNEFTRIKLSVQPIVEDTIYIGFEQSVNHYVPVGLDKNTNFGHRIYSRIDGVWEQNTTVIGTLMIRPVFGEPFAPVSAENNQLDDIQLYPNPTSGNLFIKGEYSNIKIFDLKGVEQQISISEHQINTNHLSNGIYIAVITINNLIKTIRFIKD